MNNLPKWSGKCHRCGKQSNGYIMSMFNTQLICLDCSQAEREHPRYEEARKADEEAIRNRDTNFRGIGIK